MERNHGFGENYKNNSQKDENKKNLSRGSENIEGLENQLSSEYLTELDSQISLENNIISDFEETNNFDLKEALLKLRKAGEESLKNFSEKIVDIFNSNKLTVFLRDSYISKRGSSIVRELKNEKKLTKAEDYDSFLKLLQSDFWGTSSNSEGALIGAEKALENIAKIFPEKIKEILELWPKLFRVNAPDAHYYKKFDSFLDRIKQEEFDVLESKDAKEEYLKSSNDFLALKLLKSTGAHVENIDVSLETERRLDSIILKYSTLENLPSYDIKAELFDFSLKYPDRIMADSRRINFIFKLWLSNLNNYGNSSSDSKLCPILINRIKTCSEEESDLIFKILSKKSTYYSGWSYDMNWLIDSLPIEKAYFKKLKKDHELVNDLALSFKKTKVEGGVIKLDQFDLLRETAKNLSRGDEIVFLSNLIVNYPDNRYGVSEKVLEDVLELIASCDKSRFDINILHSLTELMNRHNWSDNLKTKIFSMNNLSGRVLNKIITELNDDNSIYKWIHQEPLLFSQLELDFHSRAENNDLRHHFYEVLDNKQRTNNLDDLIKAYAKSNQYIDFEELKNLFVNNRINRDYIQYFIANIDPNELLNGLQNSEINQVDTIWFLESAVKYGRSHGSVRILKELFETINISDPEKRLELINNLVDNVLLKLDKSPTDACHQFDKGHLNFLEPQEEVYLGKKLMTGALDLNKNGNSIFLIFDNINRVNDFFENEEEKKDYLIKAFNKFISEAEGDNYLRAIDHYFLKPELQAILGDSCLEIEDKIFNTDIEYRTFNFVRMLGKMNNRQQESFISSFEKNYNLERANNNSVILVCQKLSKVLDFVEHPEIFKRIYLKFLNDPNLNSNAASALFNEDIIFYDKDLSELFFSNISRWPEIDGVKILESASLRKKTYEYFSLSADQIKNISSATMKNRGLSPKFWQGYLNSDKENQDFYLDKELFRVGLDNLGDDCFKEDALTIVEFLKSVPESEFDISEDDVKKIILGSLKNNINKT
ncbi:hypothetical protein JXK06_02230, partial [Patescibacteria group bacterium]|nr:hypothetical protein [Patescibacteria group bacterium]